MEAYLIILNNYFFSEMNFKTKEKYLKIIHAHNQIDKTLGANAPYISKGRIFELTAEFLLRTEKIKVSRSVYYLALKHERILMEEEMYLR